MLFKILHGDDSRISTDITPYHEGYCYVTHNGDFYVDMNNQRIKLNAKDAETLTGASLSTILNSSDVEIPTSKAVLDALNGKLDKADAGSDWNQNDETKPDYVKNRPFYTGDPVTTEIVNVSLSNFRQSGNLYAYQGTDFSGEPFEIGQTYQVTLDDSTYNCTAWFFNGLNCLGNSSILGDTIEGSADVPFIISRNPEMSLVYTTIDGASHSLKIVGEVFEVKEIDKKYIPALDYLDENNPTGTGAFSINREVNSDIGEYSVALGKNCVASGESSISVGTSTKATGLTAQAFGFYTEANARFSHAEGSNSIVSTNASEKVVILTAESDAGVYGHAEGFGTLVTGGVGAHAEGAMTLASGDSSHAEGYKTTASGVNSHAEGNETTASGVNSHAEGNETTASSNNSHAEGNNTTASGLNSHAEGDQTTASGNDSHAEGYSTYLFSNVFTSDNPTNDEIKNRWDSLGAASFSLAKGIGSHVEGANNLAFGDDSHAEGSNVVAYGRGQHVQGRCNIEDSSGTYAHIVGNGTTPSQRSNAHTLDWSGNAWYAGTVEGKALILPSSTENSTKKFKITVDDDYNVSATNTSDSVSKTLATTEYVDNSVSNPLNITSATVGQIAKISAVDDTGKPTAWEAVNDRLPNVSPSDDGKVLAVQQTGEFEYGYGFADMPKMYDFINLGIDVASPGQFAKVKYVDDFGHPTAWETVDMPTPFKPTGKSYLTFSSPSSFTLAVNDATKHWDGTLEYFASDRTWSVWDGANALSAVACDGEYVLYLRGTGNTVITGSRSNYKWVLTGTDISCIGNIENLLDYETVQSGAHPTMATNCYRNMFSGCTSLTQAPALPAETLANDCYYNMFYGCTFLTQVPALPATALVDGCYYSMFYGCTSLTKAPALPATTLANYCYSQMFCGCTSLTQASALPAITLANQCYDGMFAGCTSLTKAPALPATTLVDGCYHFMFLNCTSLTQAPALPATTLANQCYNGMFSGCTSLKLSSTQTEEYTQEYRIPTTGAGTTATDALTDMFTSTGGTFTGTPEINTTYYLSSDNMIVHETEIATLREYVESMIDSPFKPSGKSYLTFSSPNSFTLKVLGATKHWDGTLEYFDSNKTWTTWDGTTTLSSVDNDGEHTLYLRGTGNTQITGASQIPRFSWVLTGSDIKCVGNIENLLDYATVASGVHPTMATWCYHLMFNGCKSLTQAPELPATTLTDYCYSSMFYGCTSLTQAPALPATTLADYCYLNMFNGCKSLTKAPALSATTLADYCYQYMFGSCTSLTQAPALPATTLAQSCYTNMFNGCKSLTQAPELPATTLAGSCYESMFNGCTSLTQAPALPATTLAYNCYYRMFYGCTALTRAQSLSATTLADNCYGSMFQGCTSLTQAPELPATTLATNCYSYMFCDCTGLKLSSSKTGEYTQEYRIPSSGTGTTATDALSNMFTNTGGNFMGAPEINTTYYLSTDNMIVRETDVATLNGYVGSMIDAAIGNAIGGSY